MNFETSAPFPNDPRDLSPPQFMQQCRAHGLSERSVRQWISAVLDRGVREPERWLADGIIPKRFSTQLVPLPSLTLETVTTSPVDNFQKALFRTHDGLALETVLIPLHKPGKVSICLSSQVGCVMGCAFCATARMSQRRNLETWEIIDQYTQARDIARRGGRQVTGAVFMGMGEPFLNYDRVLAAAELLCFPISGAIKGKAITISTVGLVQEIDRFTCEKRPFRLSISLGAATDEKRAKLVPVASRTPVADVIAAARRHALARGKRVMLSYVCIGGVNVFEEDARELGRLIGDTPVRFDLIDVTDPTGQFRPPSVEELKQFRDALDRYLGQPVVRRYSGGADIQAACGTLAGAGPAPGIAASP